MNESSTSLLNNPRRILTKLVRTYLVRYPIWLFWQPRYTAITILTIISPALTYIILERTLQLSNSALEHAIKINGVSLQCAGFFIVIYELAEVRKKFSFPSEIARLRTWWDSRPRWHRKVLLRPTGLVVRAQVGKGHIQTWYTRKPSAPIDEQLSGLERNISTLRAEIRVLRKENQRLVEETSSNLKSEKSERTEENKKVLELIEYSATSSLRIALVGAVFAFEGTILSSFPELATVMP